MVFNYYSFLCLELIFIINTYQSQMQPCILCSLEYTKFNFSQWAVCAVVFSQWPLHTLVMVHYVNMPIYTIYAIVDIRSIFCRVYTMSHLLDENFHSKILLQQFKSLISRYNLRPAIRIKETRNCVTDFVKATHIEDLKLCFSSRLFFLILLLLFITEAGQLFIRLIFSSSWAHNQTISSNISCTLVQLCGSDPAHRI